MAELNQTAASGQAGEPLDVMLAVTRDTLKSVQARAETQRQLIDAQERINAALERALVKLLNGIDVFLAADCRGDTASDTLAAAIDHATKTMAIMTGEAVPMPCGTIELTCPDCLGNGVCGFEGRAVQ